jgi:DNA (cytosine-5)-methyltransferase 1
MTLPTPKAPLNKSVAEYFAGIGLVRLGLEGAGWRVVFANDFDPRKFEMYRDAFSKDHQHYTKDSVFDLSPADVPFTTLATSSFPCIDLSLAGNMNGIHGEHSSAFWGFINILKSQGDSSPPLLLIENVPGWLSSNKGADFRVTVKALHDLGYSFDALSLDARRFTPQSRLRIFIVAFKGLQIPFDQDTSDHRPKSLQTDRLRKAIQSNDDLKWASLDIPKPPKLINEGLTEKIIEKLPDNDPRWWPQSQVDRHLAMMAPSHRMRHGQQRAEVRKDDAAGCLRTAVGGSSRQFLIAAGLGQIRMRNMTPREYARLQGVPDSYPINVEANQALTGFGDAVCVPAITWIAEHALNPLLDQLIAQTDNSIANPPILP